MVGIQLNQQKNIEKKVGILFQQVKNKEKIK